jgi:hypothetical protein
VETRRAARRARRIESYREYKPIFSRWRSTEVSEKQATTRSGARDFHGMAIVMHPPSASRLHAFVAAMGGGEIDRDKL